MDPGWRIDDVWTVAGGRPVKEFLNELSKGAKAKVSAALTTPPAKATGSRFRNRAPSGRAARDQGRPSEGPFRTIYCFRPGRRIVLLHAFVKRTQQTPPDELDLARARRRQL